MSDFEIENIVSFSMEVKLKNTFYPECLRVGAQVPIFYDKKSSIVFGF